MGQIFRFAAVAVMVALASAVQAEGDSVLTITSGEQKQTYDMNALQALGEVRFETTTIWTEGVQSFVGVPLKIVVDALGIEDGVLIAAAVNDYAVEIPVGDIDDEAPIIAYERNGAPMSLRDKGPLWVVYPYDSDPSHRTEEAYSRSIWQLNRLAVK